MNKINPLSAIKAVDSATSDSSRKQFQQHAKPGQTFMATVLDSAGSNRFFLNILGNKILAQSNTIALQPGTKLNLEVITTTPLLELKIISKTPELFFGKTLTLLGKSLDVSGFFHSSNSPAPPLLDKLNPTTQKGLHDFNTLQQLPVGSKDGGTYLKLLLDRLGLSLETLLASGNKSAAALSLKTALLEIATVMEDGNELAETTSRFLGTLELYQLAQLRLSSENVFIFPLPLPFSNNGYLLVEKNDKNRVTEDDSENLRFSIHLSLEPLGNIEIIMVQTTDGLHISFACDSQIKKEFTRSHQETLKEMITSTKVIGLSFTDNAGDPTSELIQQLVPDSESMLDTKV